MEIVALVVGGLVSLGFGVTVLMNQRASESVWYFFLNVVGVGMWALGIGAFLFFKDETIARTAAQVYYVAAALIALTTLLMALSMGQKKTGRSWQLLLLVPFVALSLAILVNSHWMIESVVVDMSSNNTVVLAEPSYFIYITYFVAYFVCAMIVLALKLRTEVKPSVRKQIKSVLIAWGVSGFIGMIFNLFLPGIGNYDLIWIGPLAIFVFIPLVSFAILKYRLFDVKQTAILGIVYASTLAVLGLIYYLLAYLTSSILFQGRTSSDIGLSPVNIALALLLALLFQPLKKFFDSATNKIFYRDDYDAQKALDEVGKILASRIYVRPLLSDSLRVIAETVRPAFAKFILINPDGEPIYRQGFGELSAGGKLLDELRLLNSSIIVTRALGDNNLNLRQALDKKDIAVVAQIDILDRVNGYLLLGDKKNGTSYTRKDFDFLSVMADELAVAIENAERYEEIQELNRTLQEKVDEATKELQGNNRKLQELDKTKDEFISMASHQLRTPLTTIKGYLSMLLDGDAGKIDPAQRKFLEEAFNSSQRMVYLISDFLNVSRIQTGKFQIDLKPCNLAEILNDEIEQLMIVANSRQLKLVYDMPANFPDLNTDEDKIRQVMMNFIDNAIYYSMPKGDIRVVLSYTQQHVEFKVIDHGIGVPKSEQHKLFTKFSRASNARKQRPDGTGIGLFMAKKVIVSLGGSLIFQSVEGKGSTFGFRLNRK